MVHTVLLIPTEGDPHGLLQEGPYGAMPPTAGRFDGHWYAADDPMPDPPPGTRLPRDPDARALVFRWEGETLSPGVDVAHRVLLAVEGVMTSLGRPIGAWDKYPAVLAQRLERAGLGQAVVLGEVDDGV